MIYRLKQRWTAESGYREVLKIAFPLILSTASVSLQHFIDRVFLTWYSAEAIAASMPASLMSWTVICLFMGTAAYSGTFVAQYYGA
ncbi:MAG: MATE family efflux transporter, partial [Calditrichaeota bacterium]|nr:MATE family efflux transporter [Calditrichota bacterium]